MATEVRPSRGWRHVPMIFIWTTMVLYGLVLPGHYRWLCEDPVVHTPLKFA